MEPNKELEKAIEKKFLTPSKFALEIEKIVAEEKLNYIDAIVHYCEINELEVESVTKLVSKPLKEKLKWDATRPVSYTHLRAHETPEHLVCRLLLEKKKK